MLARDANHLLALLGHELRAPAGVIGGYLSLIERYPLTPEQTRALGGARRAQQAIIDVLDDIRRLVEGRHLEPEAATPAPLAPMVDQAVARCAELGVDLEVASTTDVEVHAAILPDVLVHALAAVALAVSRDHAASVLCELGYDTSNPQAPVATLVVVPQGQDGDGARRSEIQQDRPGLGLRLIVAVEAVRRSGGQVYDLHYGKRLAGAEIRLPAS